MRLQEIVFIHNSIYSSCFISAKVNKKRLFHTDTHRLFKTFPSHESLFRGKYPIDLQVYQNKSINPLGLLQIGCYLCLAISHKV